MHILLSTTVFFKLMQLLQECAIHLGMWASRILMGGVDFETMFFFLVSFPQILKCVAVCLVLEKEI